MGTLTYKEQVNEIANAYWQTRKVFCSETATTEEREAARVEGKRLWDAMGEVPPDPLPEWVKPELVELANKLACKERTQRYDLDGSPIVCRGTWPFDDSGYGLFKWAGHDFFEIEGLDTFNLLLKSDTLHAVLTVCEGDLTLDIFKTEAEYMGYLGYCKRFYERMAQ